MLGSVSKLDHDNLCITVIIVCYRLFLSLFQKMSFVKAGSLLVLLQHLVEYGH